MAERTEISWADHTFNPWVGCTKVSPACDGCYAEHLMATRHKRVTWGAPGQGAGTRDRTSAANWGHPQAWNRRVAALERAWNAGPDGGMGKPYPYRPFVFCASLADVFDNEVPPEWRRDLFDLIRATPHLTWLLLTKRPGNIVYQFSQTNPIRPGGYAGEPDPARAWPRNAAIGCTVVTQEEADRDIPKLLYAKAALNPAFAFVSMEPLLGPVDLTQRAWRDCNIPEYGGPGHEFIPLISGLDWVITGGETDQGAHKARPSHPDWFRSLRDQCAAAGVAYHHKQNGEWTDEMALPEHVVSPAEGIYLEPGNVRMVKVGKKRAGRAFDGRTHDARPTLSEIAR